MSHPRVLVITACTGEKRFKPDNQLTLEDFQEPVRLQQREAALAEVACPAGQMYTGMQHLQLMEGVQLLRQTFGQAAVTVAILSAGYGLVEESQAIAPYPSLITLVKGSLKLPTYILARLILPLVSHEPMRDSVFI